MYPRAPMSAQEAIRVNRRSLILAALLLATPATALAQTTALSAVTVQALAQAPGVPFAGAARADVTVVEFLDYNCPYCKKLHPELQALVRTDPKVRLLYKDWPIFGDASRYAARAALAARWQGKYLQAHDSLIGAQGRLADAARVRQVLAAGGVDLARLDRDLKIHGLEVDEDLARNDREARGLGLEGTPGLVIGRTFIPGGMPLSALQGFVARARATPVGRP